MQKLIKALKFARKHVVVLGIIWLALVLRLQYTSDFPPSLNWDEVSHGYNAYSILKTGKDEWGVSWPIIFKAYGDFKLPVYIYLTAISEFFLGLSSVAVRLPSIVAGVITVIFTYLLTRRLFSERAALLATLLVAIEPWSLFLSRGAFEANVALALIVSGVFFFLSGLKRPKYLLVSATLLGLSVWTYNSARIFVPLLLAALGFIYKRELINLRKKNRRFFTYSVILLAVFLIPMFYQLVNPEGLARYGKVSILDEGAISQINEARSSSGLPDSLARLTNNKATYFAGSFIKNYFSHFSPDFLFFEGGSQYQFSIPGHGLIYLINLPFILVGLFLILRKIRKDKGYKLIASWMFIAPVASSLTREAPHALRSIVFLPVPQIISALGAIWVLNWLRKRFSVTASFLVGIYFFTLVLQVESYVILAAKEYRDKYSWAWQYGYKEVVDYTKENYDSYEKIIITKKYGEPHEFFLFFWPWNPQEYRDDPNLSRFFQSGWYWVDRFDKFYFVNDWQIPQKRSEPFVLESGLAIDCEGQECLLISSPGNAPKDWEKIKRINFLDGDPVFEIYKN